MNRDNRNQRGKLVSLKAVIAAGYERMEEGLACRYWENVEYDATRLLELFLSCIDKYPIEIHLFAHELTQFRKLQGKVPSISREASSVDAYNHAMEGDIAGVIESFEVQSQLWRKDAVESGNTLYMAALQNGVMRDTSAAIELYVEKWLADIGRLKMLRDFVEAGQSELVLADIFKTLQERMGRDLGVQLRQNIEEQAQRKLPDIYKDPNFKPKDTSVLKFKPRR